jgi:hypothetical protein
MPDRKQREAATAEEIAQGKIDGIRLREGDPAIEDVERAMFTILQEKYGARAQEATVTSDSGIATEVPPEETAPTAPVETAGEGRNDGEVAPEVLARFQEQLKRDLGRVKERQGRMDRAEKAAYLDYFLDPASLTEEQVLAGLTDADVKKAVQMQGMGEFMGVSKGDKRVILISRGDDDGSREPERFGFRSDQTEMVDGTKQPKQGQKPIRITTDAPERDALMREIGKNGLWGDSIDIRDAVKAMGLEIPPDALDYVKKELVAAVEAVTENKFVKGRGDTYVDSIMDFDHSSRSAYVRVVYYDPDLRRAFVDGGYAGNRYAYRGAVCVLRGSKSLET